MRSSTEVGMKLELKRWLLCPNDSHFSPEPEESADSAVDDFEEGGPKVELPTSLTVILPWPHEIVADEVLEKHMDYLKMVSPNDEIYLSVLYNLLGKLTHRIERPNVIQFSPLPDSPLLGKLLPTASLTTKERSICHRICCGTLMKPIRVLEVVLSEAFESERSHSVSIDRLALLLITIAYGCLCNEDSIIMVNDAMLIEYVNLILNSFHFIAERNLTGRCEKSWTDSFLCLVRTVLDIMALDFEDPERCRDSILYSFLDAILTRLRSGFFPKVLSSFISKELNDDVDVWGATIRVILSEVLCRRSGLDNNNELSSLFLQLRREVLFGDHSDWKWLGEVTLSDLQLSSMQVLVAMIIHKDTGELLMSPIPIVEVVESVSLIDMRTESRLIDLSSFHLSLSILKLIHRGSRCLSTVDGEWGITSTDCQLCKLLIDAVVSWLMLVKSRQSSYRGCLDRNFDSIWPTLSTILHPRATLDTLCSPWAPQNIVPCDSQATVLKGTSNKEVDKLVKDEPVGLKVKEVLVLIATGGMMELETESFMASDGLFAQLKFWYESGADFQIEEFLLPTGLVETGDQNLVGWRSRFRSQLYFLMAQH
eukprot:GHVH01005813.1.p1 GENE.GHVH01005813.1~~GHVH01005813.1.p1  ORF type:complete len:602 (-),score=77.39 GHVH01005813.1:996-2780(-)